MGFGVILVYPAATFTNYGLDWDPMKSTKIAVILLLAGTLMMWHAFRVMGHKEIR